MGGLSDAASMTGSTDSIFPESEAGQASAADARARDRARAKTVLDRPAARAELTDGRADHARSGLPRRMPTVSVVIPTYNRKQVLAKTLEALDGQTLDAGLFEVIVVDDGSSDGTGELVESFQGGFDLRCERCQNGGLAAARNRGLALATHDVVVFLDDDVVPEREFRKLRAGQAAAAKIRRGSAEPCRTCTGKVSSERPASIAMISSVR